MSNSARLLLALAFGTLGGCSDHVGGIPPNDLPVARIAVTPAVGPAPLTVSFSASASTDGDTITGYAWAFGDGATATGVSAEHTYVSAGEYLVTLTVTDDKGGAGTATASVVATGAAAVYNASVFDGAEFQDEPTSGSYDTTTLQ